MLPVPSRRPPNLHISRQIAISMSVISVVVGCTIMVTVISIYGLAEGSTPIIISLAAALTTSIPGLIAALKSTESADTASKTHDTAEATRTITEFTASQTAVLQMQFNEHCGEVCPAQECPLRRLLTHGHTTGETSQ